MFLHRIPIYKNLRSFLLLSNVRTLQTVHENYKSTILKKQFPVVLTAQSNVSKQSLVVKHRLERSVLRSKFTTAPKPID